MSSSNGNAFRLSEIKIAEDEESPFQVEELQQVADEIRQHAPEFQKPSSSGKREDGFFQKRFESFAKNKHNEYVNQLKEHSPTVLLVGDTGLGKSSLVNKIFNIDIAKVSHGKPCTQDFESFGPTDTSSIRIIDGKGIEKDTAEKQVIEIIGYIEKKSKSKNVTEHVHLVYYFVGISRWQDADRECVKQLQKYCSVILVINKRDIRKDQEVESLRAVIRNSDNGFPNIDIAECGDPRGGCEWIPKDRKCKKGHKIEVDEIRKTWNCNYVIGRTLPDSEGEANDILCPECSSDAPYGYNELVEQSIKLLPKLLKRSFETAQRVNLSYHRLRATKTLTLATLAAVGVGASPIPFSDLPLLLALEATTFARLMVDYGVSSHLIQFDVIMTLNAGVVGVGGKIGYLLAQYIKAVPGFGTVSGAAIDATIAALIMLALGISFIAIIDNFVQHGIPIEDQMDNLKTISQSLQLTNVVSAIKSGNSNEATKLVEASVGEQIALLRQKNE